jgi:acyl-CoA reductase-like NAD-dependent aldehyde dehydrogenase
MTPLAYVKLGAAAAILAAVAGSALWVHRVVRERDELRIAYQAVIDANEEQTAAIAQLEAQRKVDGEAADRLADSLRVEAERERARSRRLAQVERRDPNVRSYLAAPVPAGLRCVLSDEGCGEDGDGGPPAAGGAPRAVPPAAGAVPAGDDG